MNRGWDNLAAPFLLFLLDYDLLIIDLLRAGTKMNYETSGLARKDNPPWLGYDRYGRDSLENKNKRAWKKQNMAAARPRKQLPGY